MKIFSNVGRVFIFFEIFSKFFAPCLFFLKIFSKVSKNFAHVYFEGGGLILTLWYPFSCITDPKSSKFVLRSEILTFLDFSENTLRILTDFDKFLQFGHRSMQLFFTKKREKSQFEKSLFRRSFCNFLESTFENEK